MITKERVLADLEGKEQEVINVIRDGEPIFRIRQIGKAPTSDIRIEWLVYVGDRPAFGAVQCPMSSLDDVDDTAIDRIIAKYFPVNRQDCTFGDMTDMPCPYPAQWENENGVMVCDKHKTVMDAFNWENRNKRVWKKLF